MAWSIRFAILATAALTLHSAPALAHAEGDHVAIAPWQGSSAWPDRIVATFDADPATTIAVNWRTHAAVTQARAEIALAVPDARFDLNAASYPADTETLELADVPYGTARAAIAHNAGLNAVSYHSVRFEGLLPDTLYAYRVQGEGDNWSEWFQIRTAPLSGPLRFIYLGDAQNGIDSHWPRAVRAAFQHASDARFILHAGDLVNRASRDLEWGQWFRAVGFIHGMIPAIPVAGNHEYENVGLSETDRQRMLSFLWRPQFRLPVEADLPAELHETVYDVRYSQDLHIFVLNTNSRETGAEQAAWLDRKLTESNAKWRIVTQHHPVYSSGRGRDNPDVRDVLLPVLLRHKVDLMLQGHDHTYARGTIDDPVQRPARSAPRDGDGVTTMFVNSVSGAKQYNFNPEGWADYAPTGVTLDRQAENSQFYQVISLDGDVLHYAAYTVDGELYDEVRLTKSADGRKAIEESSAALPATRLFDNTLPYSGTAN